MAKVKYEMPWGKHKGKWLEDVPLDYIQWLSKQDFCPKQVKSFAKKNKPGVIKKKKVKDSSDGLKDFYRSTAKDYMLNQGRIYLGDGVYLDSNGNMSED